MSIPQSIEDDGQSGENIYLFCRSKTAVSRKIKINETSEEGIHHHG